MADIAEDARYASRVWVATDFLGGGYVSRNLYLKEHILLAASSPAHRAGSVLYVLFGIIAVIAVFAALVFGVGLIAKAMPVLLPLVITAICLCGVLLIIGYIFNLIGLMKISGITGGSLILAAFILWAAFGNEALSDGY